MNTVKQRLLSLTLVAALFFELAIPAGARSSDYITRGNATVSAVGNGKLSITIKTYATGRMQEIGASRVIVYEKQSNGTKRAVYTVTKEQMNSLVTQNRQTYTAILSYQGVSGKSYYVTAYCYAKNANGEDTLKASSDTVRA